MTTWHKQPANLSDLTLRERFRRTMHFEAVDRIPGFEFGYWAETLPLWHQQGLPESVNNEAEAYAYFGIENWHTAPVAVGLHPPLAPKVIEEGKDYVIHRNDEGALVKELKEGIRTIPKYLEYAIKDRSDWAAFKKRLRPDTPGRIPENWPELVAEYRNRDYPLYVHTGSMLGRPRNWIGFENIALMVYDDPGLVEDIVETLCTLVCDVLAPVLEQVEFDAALGWEDICFRSGPIISPAMFERLVVPRYKRISDLLTSHGVDVIATDCDGDVTPILGQFLDGGVNCMFPVEVAAGSDPVAMREKHGREVLLHGGVDKMALLKGPRAIEEELLRLKPVVDEGGFIPHIDHRCPADVTLENYKRYLQLKREVFNAGDLKPYYD